MISYTWSVLTSSIYLYSKSKYILTIAPVGAGQVTKFKFKFVLHRYTERWLTSAVMSSNWCLAGDKQPSLNILSKWYLYSPATKSLPYYTQSGTICSCPPHVPPARPPKSSEYVETCLILLASSSTWYLCMLVQSHSPDKYKYLQLVFNKKMKVFAWVSECSCILCAPHHPWLLMILGIRMDRDGTWFYVSAHCENHLSVFVFVMEVYNLQQTVVVMSRCTEDKAIR